VIIGNHIKRLLGEGKRVILPGFGNLELKKPGNATSGEGDVMEPPGPRIRFDGGFSKDDGVLADALANGEQLDQEEARQRVLELVDAIKFTLDKGEPYQLQDVGSFTRDSDGKVHFRVDKSWILHPEQFGLEPLDLLELDESEQIEQVPREPVQLSNDETFAVEPEQPSTAGRPVTGTVPPRASVKGAVAESGRSSRWRAIWIVAAALIVILAVLIMIPSDRLNIPGRKPLPPAVDLPSDPSGSGESTSAGDIPEQGDDFERLTPERLEEEPAEEISTTPAAAEANKYFLIAGSFNHLRNASDLQDILKAKGIESEVMITENRMYRVSVGSFPTIGEAESELARVKSKPGLESCWILSN
jgi:nucleoid DNA-binding protein